MENYNLHIVRSPLQLINVVEAIKTMALKNNILIMIGRPSETNNRQIEDVLKVINYQWRKIYYVEKTSKSNFIAYVRLIKEIKKLSFENIFIGEIDTINTVIIANVNYKNVFLVDDGASTIKRHNELLKEKKVSFREKMKFLRFKLFGLKGYKPYKINFFSFFDLEQKSDEIIVKNDFKNLKNNFQFEKNYSNNVYILGQPLYNKQITEETYINGLCKIFDYYKDKDFIYLKHRYEKPTATILDFLEIRAKVVQNQYPIEFDFLLKQEYPKYITGFFSTALYTLDRMFSDAEIKAFYIEKELFFNQENGEVVNECYDFFEKNNICIVK